MSDLTPEILAELVRKYMPHANDIGMTVDVAGPPGKLRMRVAAQPMLGADPDGDFFFPSILFSLADSVCGLAIALTVKRLEPMATLDMRIDHVAPALLGDDIVADAECYRLTKSIAFARCELRSSTDMRLLATAVGTFMRASYSPKVPISSLMDGIGSAP